ncbi:hypothetical protein P171DRAFT_242632 [Karstenula rhodostoma CBS 690.94]|uniref:Asp/Glu racemase n=1 Tax=Karstenula rhodostoma CBS 690.94 TaxID=1392251 RepID=A0A9P4PPP2_9PLEO|nr:hypothetical protein P171DRAFT_242632 [Karstenula rhodostoma CBS 690.94]
MPSKHTRIGILVPSSNTALEPLTTQILSALPALSVHFTRFSVTTIGLSPSALAQFDIPNLLDAAQLLADAHVDVIGWSGTSAGWLGFDVDERLCAAVRERTGIRATTSTLALNKALRMLGVRKLGLVTPYTADVQDAVVKNYAGVGVEVSEERHLNRTDNVNFAVLGRETFDPMVESVMEGEEKVDAVATFCTNLSTSALVEGWEERFGVPVLDSVTVVVWDCLKLCGIDTAQVKGWGRLMQL